MATLGIDNLIVISDEAKQAAFESSRGQGGGVDSKEGEGKKLKTGELEFEALMRSLDNAVCIIFIAIFLLSIFNCIMLYIIYFIFV